MEVTETMIDAFLDFWSQPGWHKFSEKTKRAFRKRARAALEAVMKVA